MNLYRTAHESMLTRRSLLIASASAITLLGLSPETFLAQAAIAQGNDTSAGQLLGSPEIHDVVAIFDQDDYDEMIQAFQDSGDKNWIEATLTIDGQTFENVGMRLKGNSSIMGLRGDMAATAPGMAATGQGQSSDGSSGGQLQTGDGSTTNPSAPAFQVGSGPMGNVSLDEPEGLPWLVRLDKYVEGQSLDGLTEFAIRSNMSESSLNEALALELLSRAGLPSQISSYIRFTVNESDPRLRLAIEIPDDRWLEQHFAQAGTLFKSEAEGNWSYRGDDFEAYTEVFDLEGGSTGEDADDYAPLISFLDFLNNSDDATFEDGLPDRLDVDSFAIYLAMMDLIQNDDDIDGPGNNAYLFQDTASGLVTVIPWDMNLAFGGLGDGGPLAAGSLQPPAQILPPSDPPDTQTPQDADIIQMQPILAEAGHGGGRGGAMENPLVRRWQQVEAFTTLQSAASARLADELFESGVASGILSGLAERLETQALDLIDRTTIDEEVASLKERIDAA